MRQVRSMVLVAALAMPAVGCVGLGLAPAEKSAVIAEVEAQVREGTMTQAQGEAIKEIIESDGQIDWDAILYGAGGLALSVITALTGVRIQRGPGKPMDKSQASALRDLVEQHMARKSAEQAMPAAEEKAA